MGKRLTMKRANKEKKHYLKITDEIGQQRVLSKPSLVRGRVRPASFLKVETKVRDAFEGILLVSSVLGLAFLGECS